MALRSVVLTFDMLEEIAAVNPSLGLTIKEALKGAAAVGGGAGAGAMAGGLIGGPPGMLLGGFVGYVAGSVVAYTNMDDFKPLSEVFKELTAEDKKKLIEIGQTILKCQGLDAAHMIFENYGSEMAKNFLTLVYEEYSGKKLSHQS